MTAFKTGALTIVVFGVLGSFANAAPLSWTGGSYPSWPMWYASQYAVDGTVISAGTYRQTTAPIAWWNGFQTSAQARAVSAARANAGPAPVDAFINMGDSQFAGAATLTTGGARSWTTSPTVTRLFDGVPDAQEQAGFTQQVLANMQHTFQISGLDVSLTSDPGILASHTMSLVSGTSYGGNTNAIGITEVGRNGFGFIDKLSYASSTNELAWAVAHNLSHELMHALGVGTHPDTSGQYLDTATATWSMLTDPNTRFSPEAVDLMRQGLDGGDFGNMAAQVLEKSGDGSQCHCQFCLTIPGAGPDGAQVLAQPVPEPATIMVWGLGSLIVGHTAYRRARRRD